MDPAKRRSSGDQLRALLARDLFEDVRTDEELSRLVGDTALSSETPYAELLHRLIGSSEDLPEDDARTIWLDAVAHRRELSVALGRPVHIRVATLDLLTLRGLNRFAPSLVVPRTLIDQMVQSLIPDELTGLMNRSQFATILAHELRQRQTTPLVLARMDLEGMKSVTEIYGHDKWNEIVARFGRISLSTARKGDAIARFGPAEFGALFVGCGQVKASEIVRRIENILRKSTDGIDVSLAAGVVAAKRGETPESILERAVVALEDDRSVHTDGILIDIAEEDLALRPVSVYASADPSRFFDLHRAFAEHGYALIPARNPESARLLCHLLSVRVLVSDVLFPPKGGIDLFEQLLGAGSTASALLVAPRNWSSLQKARAVSYHMVTVPVDFRAVGRVLTKVLGPALSPLPSLQSEVEAQNLILAVNTLIGGRVLSDDLLFSVGSRVEVDVIKRHLGR